MGVLIDASILIEHERGRLELEPHLDQRPDEEFFLSVISASELLHGVHHAVDAATRARRAAWVEAVLDRFPLLPVDMQTARAHAQIWADLSPRGQLIGPNDLWLAASCIANGLVMVTANERGFRRVPGLALESWARRA